MMWVAEWPEGDLRRQSGYDTEAEAEAAVQGWTRGFVWWIVDVPAYRLGGAV